MIIIFRKKVGYIIIIIIIECHLVACVPKRNHGHGIYMLCMHTRCAQNPSNGDDEAEGEKQKNCRWRVLETGRNEKRKHIIKSIWHLPYSLRRPWTSHSTFHSVDIFFVHSLFRNCHFLANVKMSRESVAVCFPMRSVRQFCQTLWA